MTPTIWLILGILAIVALAVVAWTVGKRSEAQLAVLRLEMQNALTGQAQTLNTQMTAQISQFTQSVGQQLGQVRQELQSGVASSGQLASDAQREVAQRLQSSTEALMQISQRIGEVHQTSQDLSKAAMVLQSVLGGAKTRGTLGEVTLDRLLGDALPQAAYETQYKFPSTGAIVDAIVRNGERILSIDSKFPLEAYRRLGDGGDEARKDFCVAVRKHADAIADKYILPNEHTLDYALMFVPSEGVYYELLMSEDSKYGLLDQYCRGKKVFAVSPNTFYAYLSAVAVSLKGQQMEENARHILASLAGLKKQFDLFGDTYSKLGSHLRHAQQSYEDADSRLNRTRNSLAQISQGALFETPSTLFESASRD